MPNRVAYLAILFLLTVTYAYFPIRNNVNSKSRLDVLHAIFVHKTLSIDAYHQNTIDKASFNGRYYSSKPPGTIFLALPGFTVGVLVLRYLDVGIDSQMGWRVTTWFATVGSVGLLSAFGAVAMFALLAEQVRRRIAFVTVIGVFLGSLPFTYATILFNHAGTIGLLSIALWILLSKQHHPKTLFWKINKDFVAGLACGFSIIGEYVSVFAVGGLLLLAFQQSKKRLFRILLGMVPAVVLHMTYTLIIYNDPFILTYEHTTFRGGREPGELLIAVYKLLFSQYRGLFFWCPLLLFSFIGFRGLKKFSHWLPFITILVCTLTIYKIGNLHWSGGWSLGPRHLSSIIPFVTLSAGLGAKSFPRTGTFLSFLSILLTGIATLISVNPREEIMHPLVDYYLPALLEGKFTTNIGHLMGLRGIYNILPLGIWMVVGAFIIWLHLDKRKSSERW